MSISLDREVADVKPPASWPLAIGATSFTLILAFVLKDQCASHPWANSFQYRHLCYNDLQPLYEVRGIHRGLLPYLDVRYEYPPVQGFFMFMVGALLRWLNSIGLIASAGNESYLRLSSLLLAPFAYGVTLLLRPVTTRGRLMVWALGTPLLLYSFHNWDLIAVLLATWGLVSYESRRWATSGAALGIGASAKLYPGFLMGPLMADSLARRDKKAIYRGAASFVLIFLVINLPVFLAARGVPPVFNKPNWGSLVKDLEIRSPKQNGWIDIWTFHAGRYPDFGTVWYWIAHHARSFIDSDKWRAWWDVPAAGSPGGYRDFVSFASLALFLAGSLALLIRGWKRRNLEGDYPVVAVGLGIISVFLLTSKVNSPQYALWLVPLLAMTNVPLRLVLAYFATDLAVYVSGFYWFTVFDSPAPAWKGLFEVAVLARAVALVFLAASSWRSSRLLPSNVEAHPGYEAIPISPI